MPIYEYLCEQCGHSLEMMQNLRDEPLRTCPQCYGDCLQQVLLDFFPNSTLPAALFVDAVLESSCTGVYTPVLRSASPPYRLGIASLERSLFSAPSFQLKGQGWYKSDYANKTSHHSHAPSQDDSSTTTTTTGTSDA